MGSARTMTRARLGIALVAVVLLNGCSKPVEVVVGDADARTVTVDPGDEFVVVVTTNASIGWTWKVTGEPDRSVATFVDREYVADSPEATGSGGVDRFRFRAEGEGQTTIVLSRDFRGEGVDRTVTVTVRVGSG